MFMKNLLKILLMAQFLFVQTSFAKLVLEDASMAPRLYLDIGSWRSALGMALLYSPQSEVKALADKLVAAGISLDSPFEFRQKGDEYFYKNEKIKFTGSKVEFRGRAFSYNPQKGLNDNFEEILKKFSDQSEASHKRIFKMPFFLLGEEAFAMSNETKGILLIAGAIVLVASGAAVFGLISAGSIAFSSAFDYLLLGNASAALLLAKAFTLPKDPAQKTTNSWDGKPSLREMKCDIGEHKEFLGIKASFDDGSSMLESFEQDKIGKLLTTDPKTGQKIEVELNEMQKKALKSTKDYCLGYARSLKSGDSQKNENRLTKIGNFLNDYKQGPPRHENDLPKRDSHSGK